MSYEEIVPLTSTGPRIEKKVIKILGEPVGEVEQHFDAKERVIFEKSLDLKTNAVNTVEYVWEGDTLKQEIWKDKEGRTMLYAYNEAGERELLKKDLEFKDVDF